MKYIMANEVHNATTLKDGKCSPIELFTQVNISPKLHNSHTFGSPVYMLDSKLQLGTSLPKWKSRPHLKIHLGPSPNHAWCVSLVLNPRREHVSPQFHVKHDDFFETVSGRPTPFNSPEPWWKSLADSPPTTTNK